MTWNGLDIPTLEEIEALPVTCRSQADNQHGEDFYHDGDDGALYLCRWWISRCGPEDGATYKACLEYRDCPNGSWSTVELY